MARHGPLGGLPPRQPALEVLGDDLVERRLLGAAPLVAAGGPCGPVVVLDGKTELPQVARAARPPRRLAGRLHRRQEEADEHGDDRDDDEELDEGETM
jgi:hypothetical protein